MSFISPTRYGSFMCSPTKVLCRRRYSKIRRQQVYLLKFSVLRRQGLIRPPTTYRRIRVREDVLFPQPVKASSQRRRSSR